MDQEEREERLETIRVIIHRLQCEISELVVERNKLELEEARASHTCSCVKLNGDIEIYDMVEQERRGRRGLQLGTVAETLSARKDCRTCGGTGKPNPPHNHNEFSFDPDTCPACRVVQRNID